MGYNRAGFSVTGVDIAPQKRYPFTFIQGDAVDYLINHGCEYDAIHASPPCQKYSIAGTKARNAGKQYLDHIPGVRAALIKIGKPYVIENVPGSPLKTTITLCGLMFGLKVFRHRNFECSHLVFGPPHPSHAGKRIGEGMFSVAGGAGRWHTWGATKRDVSKGSAEEWRNAMGINWMTRKELTQAIPPAYTEYIGRQLINALDAMESGAQLTTAAGAPLPIGDGGPDGFLNDNG